MRHNYVMENLIFSLNVFFFGVIRGITAGFKQASVGAKRNCREQPNRDLEVPKGVNFPMG